MFSLCTIGIHNWKQTQRNTYRSAQDEKLGIQETRARRVCTKCNKVQEMDVHCLGLNPPKYVRSWCNPVGDKVFVTAHDVRKIAEDCNYELQRILVQVRDAAQQGKTNMSLKGWDDEHPDDGIQIRELLKGLGYGSNKHGTGGPSSRDLMVYW